MKLQGFSKYEFSIRDGVLIVRNVDTKRLLSPVRDDYHYRRKFQLRDDNGNQVSVQELRIAYCLLNHCGFADIKGKQVTGSVQYPRLRGTTVVLPQDEKLRKLHDIEFCLEQLRHYYLTGDISFFVEYARQSRYQAIATTSALTSAPVSRLSAIYDEATDDFLKEVEACNFASVKPLFGMLCKALKVRFFRSAGKRNVSLDAINH